MRSLRILGFIFCVLSLGSCVMTSDIFSLGFDKNKGKEAGIGDFVKMRNGELIKADIKKSKLGIGLLNKKGSVTMADGTVYQAKDVEEFQMDSIYFKRIPGSEKLFYGRKKSGKINLYYRHFVDRGTDSRGRSYYSEYDLHWLQKGKDAPIQKFSVKLLESMVADNNEANAFMQEYKNKSSKKRRDSELNNIIDVYNGKA